MVKSVKRFITLLVIASIIVFLMFIFPKLEWNSPKISFLENQDYLGASPFLLRVEDEGQGLKKLLVNMTDKHGKTVLIDKEYPRGTNKDEVEIKIDKKKLGLKEGTVKIQAIAEDYSRLKIFRGNRGKVTREFKLDLTIPKIIEISSVQYLAHGGSGFIIYKVSEEVSKSGIQIGDYFFNGYGGEFKDPNVYICFFAYPYDQVDNQDIFIIAEDRAGNKRKSSVYYNSVRSRYKRSDINVSENFINRKMAPLIDDDYDEGNLKDIFLKVNNELRTANNNKINEITLKTEPKMLWNGRFTQLSNSKVEANFADRRSYKVNGEKVDEQYHLGYDLSVTKRYPVEASNSGKVVFADDMGIYGSTVIIDHGMGIMTLYSHLSSISVNEGDIVNKNDIVGRTGESGLAAGDHLHFGVYVHGVAVRPLEWWDGKWVREKITDRINQAKSEFGEPSKSTTKEENSN